MIYSTEQERQLFTTAPYVLAEAFATLLKYVDCDTETTRHATKVLGYFIYESETLCAHLISSPEKAG